MHLDFNFLFLLVHLIILPVWLILIFLPKNKTAAWFTDNYLFQMILSLVYIFLLLNSLNHSEGGMHSLSAIRKGFESDDVLLLGWIHYLIFDAIIGTLILRHSIKHFVPHLHIVFPLLLTLLFGPIGWLFYVVYCRIKKIPLF